MFKEVAIYYEYTLNKANYINKLAHHVPSASNQKNKNNIYIYIYIYILIYMSVCTCVCVCKKKLKSIYNC